MLGVDVVDVARLQRALARPGLAERLFTPAELERAAAKARPAEHLAGVLAAKEAAMKALGLRSLPAWARRIEIERDGAGAPRAVVAGAPGEVVLSIAHDGGVAVAAALQAAPCLRQGRAPLSAGAPAGL